MQKILRTTARYILGILTRLVIKKHSLLIIAITGENSPSIIREAVYGIVSQKYNARRNLERTESEFSIPLTVIGQLTYPTSYSQWVFIVFKTLTRLVYIKPYEHAIIMQIPFITKDIAAFWLKVLNPQYVINTDADISTGDISKIIQSELPHSIQKLCTKLEINKQQAQIAIENIPLPAPRIQLAAGKNKSVIIDARHYYYPPSLQSTLEMTQLIPGAKYLLSTVAADKTLIPIEYQILNPRQKIHPKPNDIYIFRGQKPDFNDQISELSMDPFTK